MTDPQRWIRLHEAELHELEQRHELVPSLDGRPNLFGDTPELLEAVRELVATP